MKANTMVIQLNLITEEGIKSFSKTSDLKKEIRNVIKDYHENRPDYDDDELYLLIATDLTLSTGSNSFIIVSYDKSKILSSIKNEAVVSYNSGNVVCKINYTLHILYHYKEVVEILSSVYNENNNFIPFQIK